MSSKILLSAAAVVGATAFAMSAAADGRDDDVRARPGHCPWRTPGGGGRHDESRRDDDRDDGKRPGRNENPGVLPPQSSIHGATYAQWSARWWQWAYSSPTDSNPVTDTTGEFASNHQSGNVWFLAGTFGATGVTRTVSVPAGKALFLPILNESWVTWPAFTAAQYPPAGYPGDPPFTQAGAEQAARDAVAGGIDAADVLALDVDGKSLTITSDYRAKSPVFSVTVPADNEMGVPAGTYGDSVSDGYWVMLAPLSRGQHAVRIHGGIPGSPRFDTEVTYHLTVE